MPLLIYSIRLLKNIFTAASDIPELKRQLVTPNVSKYSGALIRIIGMHDDEELKVFGHTNQ